MVGTSKRFLTVALFTILLVILVNLVWWLFYNRVERLLEQQLGKRLRSVAASTASGVTPLEIELMFLEDQVTLQSVSDRLEQVRADDTLSELFLLDRDLRYYVTTLIEHDEDYFLTNLNGPLLDSIFSGDVDGAAVTPTYQSGDILLKSAFAPVRDSSGDILAVVGAEASVDYFDSLSDLRRQLFTASALSIVGGLILGTLFLLLQRAITRAEQQLYLAQTQTWLGRMVAVVAHEVRNPLMIIRASAERLLKKHGGQEAEFIVEETDRLNAIVSGYLTMSKAEGPLLAGEQPEEFDLIELVQSLMRNTQEKFQPQMVTWFRSPHRAPLSMYGYRRPLRQVLLNLVANGAEACVAAGRPIELGIEILQQGDKILIRLSDHGTGFSRSEQKQLFTPFFTTKSKGSGLGLYLSQKIVAEMGGSLKIAESDSKGTTLDMEFPLTVRT